MVFIIWMLHYDVISKLYQHIYVNYKFSQPVKDLYPQVDRAYPESDLMLQSVMLYRQSGIK